MITLIIAVFIEHLLSVRHNVSLFLVLMTTLQCRYYLYFPKRKLKLREAKYIAQPLVNG